MGGARATRCAGCWIWLTGISEAHDCAVVLLLTAQLRCAAVAGAGSAVPQCADARWPVYADLLICCARARAPDCARVLHACVHAHMR